MATTQQLLDLKYGRQLMEDRARLSELFSEDILGALFLQGRYTFEEILATTSLNLGYQNGLNTSFKGLELLKNLQTLFAGNSIGGEINLSSLTQLEDIDFGYCFNLEDVGSLKNLQALKYLRLYNTKVTNLGSLSTCTDLIIADLYNNKLTNIAIDFTSLVTLNLSGNIFSSADINTLLGEAYNAVYLHNSPLQTLNLDGATMGIISEENGYYRELTDTLNVDVTIQTA
jgi:hypothetical protein